MIGVFLFSAKALLDTIKWISVITIVVLFTCDMSIKQQFAHNCSIVYQAW